MIKAKFVLLSIIVVSLLCWQFLPMNTPTASSGIVNACSSSTWFYDAVGTRCLIVCPQGDGTTLESGANRIALIARDNLGIPIEGILATDVWLVGCTDLCLCGGSGSSDADSATNDNGQTTISGSMAAGGCDTGLHVVVQGIVIGCPAICHAIDVRSPDISCDLVINLVDFSIFASHFPPGPYDACCDYDCNGVVNLVDFSIFAQHWQHSC